MANGNAFAQALERSTPGFNELLNVIQTETNRIERNRAMAEQREAQLDLFEAKERIRLERQKEQTRDRLEAETESQKELIKFKNKFKEEEPLFTREDIREFTKNADKKSNQIRNRYGNVFDELAITNPNVSWTLNPTSGTATYYQTITNFKEKGDSTQLPEQQFRNVASQLQVLANWVKEGRNKRQNLLGSEDLPSDTETNYIARDDVDDQIQRIRDATIQEKLQYAEMVKNNQLEWAEASKVGGTSDEERDLSATEAEVQSMYLDIRTNYKNLKVPEVVRDYQEDIGKTLDLFDPNVTYQDVERLRRNMDNMLRNESVSVIQLESGKTVFEDPHLHQLHQGVNKYVELMHKTNELPNTKVNPVEGLTSGSFGLRDIDPEERDLTEMWEERQNVQDEVNVTERMLEGIIEGTSEQEQQQRQVVGF